MPPPPSKRSSKGEDSVGALRTITSLLSTSDTAVLPTHIPTIVSLLYSSSVLESCHALANAQQKKKSSEDAGVLLHKYKTRISALLQSKTAQSRWCGAALVKASVESSWECLAGHGSVWIRLLVPLLARPEPTATHRVIIATLARVFTALTENKPTLVREIVVPNLPATIGHLLAATESENELLAVVLEALRDILQAHPVTFRPFAQKTYTLVLNVLSSANSACSVEERLAREIFALLHLCASGSSSRGITNNTDGSSSSGGNNKATAVADEWTRGFRAVIEDTHLTLNTLFRCVIEDSDYGSQRSDGKKELTSEAHGTSTLGLSDWKGLTDGVERVSVLLRQLQSFFTLPSTAQVSIPIGQLIDLTTRIFSIAPSSAQINQAVERSEREFVFARLPELQRGALNLLSTVLARLGSLFIPFALMLIDQIAHVFAEQGWNSEVKMAIYTLLNTLLETFGSGLPKPSVHAIHTILSSTCDELLPPASPAAAPTTTTTTAPPKGGIGKPKNSTSNGTAGQNFHADAFLSVLPTGGRFVHSGLVAAAETLLATALARLPTACVRSELRTKMDRTAVLTGNTEAMLASVLFPPLGARRGGAVLPHLVGAGSKKALVIEGVVRPRLPVIWTGKRKAGEEEDDEMEIAEEQPEDDDEEDSEEENEEESVGPLASYSKKPYPVEMETTSDESPFKRQKTEAMNSTMQETIAARKPSLLDDMILAQAAALAQSSAAAAAPAPEPLLQASAPQSSITAVSSSFVSTTVVSGETHVETTQQQKKTTTTTVEKSRDFTEGGESDDDMVIPEIVMGGDSSEDEDDDEE
ncbi:uncharacterized protein H6S33_000208 [Morchella sextelata]|uniref:uncharacterized protein n=1 Tax=Morchella sextelata TaxID=1174677 RepID=UPI001D04E124|nr:uncharacterized protein H6S33_000208 [Morchella sextelata]KAH0614572.1 hypothetical protein H6S33_000208 [Morchella sextelata]